MKAVVRLEPNGILWPDPWQMMLVALCTLILCSCRSATPSRAVDRASSQVGLPAEAYAGPLAPGGFAGGAIGPPGMEKGVPLPLQPQGPWTAAGVHHPWPEDEYLRDGGDQGRPVGANKRAEVVGLKMEDTVAKYNTRDGHTVVQVSNEVALYSPRFGAVRQVVGAAAEQERQKAAGVDEPIHSSSPQAYQFPAGAKQNLQLNGAIVANPAVALRSKQGDGALSSALGPRGFQDRFKPYENLAIIRQGMLRNTDMLRLARGATAAIAWSQVESLEILLDRKNATADVKYDQAMGLYTVNSPPGRPRFQLVKVASKAFAKPGEEVDFTLRFDNLGNETIGQVAVLDSLSTRLEYVPNSAQCSVAATFTTQPNEGDSLVLRCDLAQPLQPGQGGILRFRCRVR